MDRVQNQVLPVREPVSTKRHLNLLARTATPSHANEPDLAQATKRLDRHIDGVDYQASTEALTSSNEIDSLRIYLSISQAEARFSLGTIRV